MLPSEREKNIAKRRIEHGASSRVKTRLARLVDDMISERPQPDPEHVVLASPVNLRERVEIHLAQLIVRTNPDAITDKMNNRDFDVTLSLDMTTQPPTIAAELNTKGS